MSDIIPFEDWEFITDKAGRLSERGREFLLDLTNHANFNSVVLGTGSPEGAITAEPGKIYIDTTGTTGSVIYAKQTGIGDTGWGK